MRRLFHINNLLIGMVIGVLLLVNGGAYIYYYYDSPGPLAEQKTVLFPRGMRFRDIVDELSAREVIRYPLLFKGIAVMVGDARRFKAGEYRFSAAISPRLIMEMIAEGRVVVHRMPIPEGLTVKEIIALLKRENALAGEIATNYAEGSLLPSTYHFVHGDSRGEMMERMHSGMEVTIAELWLKRKDGLPLATPQEAVTLASIVEKETDLNSERGRIAAVFYNRLKKGMRLQSDPTVIYAIAQGPLGRPLLRSDLAIDSPYNTYKYAGLPPGPISNPGRASLQAVLNPPETSELYFVATGDGGHNFSPTLDVHNKYVREYRAKLKQDKQEKSKQEKPVKQ